MGLRPFFEIAATLIPVLLFGGILLGARDPSGAEVLAHRIRYFSLPVLAMFAILGEVFAIKGAVAGESSVVERVFVFSAILLGMAGISLNAALPAARAVRRDLGYLGEDRRTEVWVIATIALSTIVGFFVLWQAVGTSEKLAAGRKVDHRLAALHKCFVGEEQASAAHSQKAASLASQLLHARQGHRGAKRLLNYAANFESHLAETALDKQTRCEEELNRILNHLDGRAR